MLRDSRGQQVSYKPLHLSRCLRSGSAIGLALCGNLAKQLLLVGLAPDLVFNGLMEDVTRFRQRAIYSAAIEAVTITDVMRRDEDQIALALAEIIAQ